MAFKRVLSLEHPVLDFSRSPSLARQEFLADSDINRIVDRFLHTGVLPQPNLGRPSVDGLDCPGDFSEACDMLFANEAQSEQSNEAQSEQSNEAQDGDNQQSATPPVEEEQKKKE